jgi:hypothetical protein
LEERLDNIVKLLQTSQAPNIQTPSFATAHFVNQCNVQAQHGLQGSISPKSNIIALPEFGNTRNASIAISQSSAQEPPTPAYSSSSSEPKQADPNAAFTSTGYPPETQEECEEYLESFRSKMIPSFPIIVLGPEVTVQELREQRPFLWLVIRAICNKIVKRQRALGKEIREVLGREILVEGAKNLDLLLGVLVYGLSSCSIYLRPILTTMLASWCCCFVHHKPILTTMVQLAISLASDLGLLKPIPSDQNELLLHLNSNGCPKPPHLYRTAPRTMEERRAIVGLFLLTSM